MADDIGKAFAHEEWLKDRVEEELKNTESEFGTIIDANQMRSTDAAATVVAALNQLNSFKKLENESNEAFAARMKITFDADEAYPRVPTMIDIPDLPSNAPPSTRAARTLLVKFDDQLSYQLTWAQWLMGQLEECCDEVAAGYAKLSQDYVPSKDDVNLALASLLTDLYELNGDKAIETNNDFAIRMRKAFDDNQLDPATKIADVTTGIVIEEPPANCQMSTFDARDALRQFSDDLTNVLTYQAWLAAEMGKACEALRADINAEIATREDEIAQKEGAVASALEVLMTFIGRDGEKLLHFGKRMRHEYERDDTAPKLESDVVVPFVPAACDPETLAARDALQKLKEDYDDCLSYLEWLNTKLT